MYRTIMRDVFPESVALNGLKNEKKKFYDLPQKEQKSPGMGHHRPRSEPNFVAYGNFFCSV
jgi:hypothetical protein